MFTSEEIIDSLMRETGIIRTTNNITSHILSKQEMKDILVFIVSLKSRNKELEKSASDTKKIVEEVMQQTKELSSHE
jgi:hypothetical protein